MENYIKLFEDNYKTVVKKYERLPNKEFSYQTEKDLENELIQQLSSQGYEYIRIHNHEELKANLRKQIERLNNIEFDDNSWKEFYNQEILNQSDSSIEAKTRTIQVDYYKNFKYHPNKPEKNIYLIDKNNHNNNILQVINQVSVDGNVKNRYDVTILVNGLPLVHIELKSRGRNIKEAFNQIERYQRESFWADDGLYEYVQIFIISNGEETLYYSNTTRWNIKKDSETFNYKDKAKTSNSFEFTIAWADQGNTKINDLQDFTRTFLARRTLLNILTKYCIFNHENKLIVMRPYQISATENIIEKIFVANQNKWQGTTKAGGYIWHTTGSGKTLTSFKTAQLVTNLDFIHKVIFVVDRKDLYYQTIKEYEKIDKDIFSSSRNTKELQEKLEDNSLKSKIIVTSIQKLSRFVTANKGHDIYDKNVVIIFDECHRSQFGDMHNKITKSFKNYFLFGFTGTPIFKINLNHSNVVNPKKHEATPIPRTTQELFGEALHIYTIKEAIRDGKVLPFSVDYWQTMRNKSEIKDEWVKDIAKEQVLLNEKRISGIVKTVLDNFYTKTKQGNPYSLNIFKNNSNNNRNKEQKQITVERDGFNSIFTCWSIEALRKYYTEFKKQIASSTDSFINSLKIATIFSYDSNQEETNQFGELGEEVVDGFDLNNMVDKDFLLNSIDDYNKLFSSNISPKVQGWFYDYYLKVQEAVRNKEIDILLVVNMFLTGFDAPTLNTLWVDRNLEMHGLIQAFSRTNRIFDSVKNAGNIVSFRNLSEKVDKAIATFSNEQFSKETDALVLLRTFKDYYYGYINEKKEKISGYKELAENFLKDYPIDLDLANSILTGEDKKKFIADLNKILKLENILICFSQFDEDKKIIKDRPKQNYLSFYQKVHDEVIAAQKQDKASIYDDVVFEMKIIKTQEYKLDEIIYLIIKDAFELHKTKEYIINELKPIIEANTMPKSKKELLLKFIEELNGDEVDDGYVVFNNSMKEKYDEDLDNEIKKLKLNGEKTKRYMRQCLFRKKFTTLGEDFPSILPPYNPFFDNDFEKKKLEIVNSLQELFNKYVLIYNEDIRE